MKAPYEAQEFDVSVKDRRIAAANALGMQSLGQALRRFLPTAAAAPADDEAGTSAERPEGCWCRGRGGRDAVPVMVFAPPEGELQLTRVLYSETDAPLTWGTFCSCPDGVAAREQRDREREAMRLRGELRKAKRLLAATRIPKQYEALDLSTYPNRTLAGMVERWYLGQLGELVPAPDDDKPFLYLSGPNRRGKTGLAIGVLKLALAREIDSLFRTVASLLDELAATFDRENPACHADILALLKEIPLLLLDDLGANRLTEWRAETINSILDHRQNERKLTVLTTNLGWRDPRRFDETELMDVCGERVYWRIRANARHIAVDGPVLGL